MRTAALLIALLPLVAYAENGGRSELLRQLGEAQEKWRRSGTDSYLFTISNGCFCLHPPYVGPIRLTIKKGMIKRTVYVGDRWGGYSPGQTVRSETHLRKTIPQLFSEIEKMIGMWNAEYIRAEYDGTDGHPVRFEYDDPELEDEQTDIRVVEFSKL